MSAHGPLTVRPVGTQGHDPLDAAEQDAQVAPEAATRAENARRQEIEDFKWVAAHPQGRRFLWRFLGMAGIYRQSMVTGSSDVTSFNEGRRSLGLALMDEFHAHSLEAYLRMVKEHNAS